ncbi:PH domain-containing protein [Halobacillus sp. A1]|uniref:PH domain-containing protein n=1 Tax=Halobacillus sp. A1 TaxID=2880262 RepID=UPI0020A689FB|nr:PH domain-containing protein [Halobacillus sp. A1]MCP3029855.1 PH domain-containing protein [Halobacillus sp. A1]
MNGPILRKRLSNQAVKVWIVTEITATIFVLLVVGVVLWASLHLDWPLWIRWSFFFFAVFPIFLLPWSMYRPFLLYRNWRYDVSVEFLRLKRGALKEVHDLIPMSKVQHVRMEQGPLLKKYGLCTIKVQTISSSHEIPMLPKDIAVQLKERIAFHARIVEESE